MITIHQSTNIPNSGINRRLNRRSKAQQTTNQPQVIQGAQETSTVAAQTVNTSAPVIPQSTKLNSISEQRQLAPSVSQTAQQVAPSAMTQIPSDKSKESDERMEEMMSMIREIKAAVDAINFSSTNQAPQSNITQQSFRQTRRR